MTRLEFNLQSETEDWKKRHKLWQLLHGVVRVTLNNKDYLLSGRTIARLVKEAEHGIR
ncbi:hypothetical protein N2E09_04345 [Leuconostoc citreum]